ncbi:MAG: PD-(D/E)XK nuclease family transposase, partial [Bacteroidales bacterium]|nr:PD-(D/E)XK nuclease family transposase [Bacteroidales bacterium]
TEDELKDMLDKWLFAMKNLDHLRDRSKGLREAIFKRLFNLAEISKYKPNELLAYRDSLKDYRDYYNTIDFAEIKGRKEGREEGLVEGAQSKAYEIARKMKSSGLDTATIIDFTGLSSEEIEKI